MHDSFRKQVLQRASDLKYVLPHFKLGDELSTLSLVLNKLFKISVLGPFNGDEHFIVLNKRLDVPGNVSMLQFLHELDLLDAVVSLLYIVHIKNFQKFQCYKLAGLDILGLEDEGKLALAYRHDYAVVTVDAAIEFTVADRCHLLVQRLLIIHYYKF